MFSTKKLKETTTDKTREQEETARVYAEFVKSFDVNNATKNFLRGGIVSKLGDTLVTQQVGKPSVYKPQKSLWIPSSTSSILTSATSDASLASTQSTSFSSPSPSGGASTASNSSSFNNRNAKSKTREIDSFLEEIKKKQMIIEEKKKLTKAIEETKNEDEKEVIVKRLASLENISKVAGINVSPINPSLSSSATDYQEVPECSTNLYIGNLSPEITEEFLCQQFGKYGVIRSVKIMYPRTEEEKMRKRNCGFVSFQNRQQAENAKNALDNTEFYGMAVRIGWGKSVAKPTSIPTTSTFPVGFAGDDKKTEINLLNNSSVKSNPGGFSDVPPILPEIKKINVKVPKSRRTKILIDLLAKYVAEEGHPFEQCIMEKESPTGRFRFLFEHNSDDNIYYRWLVYAYAQGDTTLAWRTEGFEIYSGGSFWIPPAEEYFLQPHARAVSDNLNESFASQAQQREKMRLRQQGKQKLTLEEAQSFRSILDSLDYTTETICNAMTFCLDHAFCAIHITEQLYEELTASIVTSDQGRNESIKSSNRESRGEKETINTEMEILHQKIKCLYLLSDVLYNSSCLQPSAWAYRNALENILPELFYQLNSYQKSLSKKCCRIFKERVLHLIEIWETWAIYAPQFIQGLHATFLLSDNNLKLNVNEFDKNEGLYIAENFLDEKIDGEQLQNFEEYIKLPLWLRPIYHDWNKIDDLALCRLCKSRGLLSNDFEKRKNLIMSCLVNFELLWNSNAAQLPKNKIDEFSSDDENKYDERKLVDKNDDQESELNCPFEIDEKLVESNLSSSIVTLTSDISKHKNSVDIIENGENFYPRYDIATTKDYEYTAGEFINLNSTLVGNDNKIREISENGVHSDSSDDIFASSNDGDSDDGKSSTQKKGNMKGNDNSYNKNDENVAFDRTYIDIDSRNSSSGKVLQNDIIHDGSKAFSNIHDVKSSPLMENQSISRSRLRQVELEVIELQVNLERQGLDTIAIEKSCEEKRKNLIKSYEDQLKSGSPKFDTTKSPIRSSPIPEKECGR